MLLLATQAYSHGGVQAYTRRLMEILSAYGEWRSAQLHCVSLLDSNSYLDQHPNSVKCARFRAAAGSKSRFVRMAVTSAWAARPRLIVAAHIGVAPVAWLLRKTLLGGPYILVLHGIEAWRQVSCTDRIATTAARFIVATTRHTARVFARENHVPEESIRIIPLALPDSSCTVPSEFPQEPNLRVLAVSRLTKSDSYKGIDTLIDAIFRVRSVGAEVALTIVGSGDDRDRLEKHAAALGLNGSVRFAGSVPDEELQQELVRSDVFALPSSGEGFGIVYLEAMRHGRPCIAGNHGGAPELIENGADGFLVEHGDVNQLCCRLLALYRSPSLVAVMGSNARRKVESEYLFPRMRERWFSLLDTVLN
jgi:glycosyltransferase involved in cell wall biosynthesis